MKFFTIYGHGGHVGHVTQSIFEQPFFPKGPGVSEEKSFEIVDGRTTMPAYTISYPGAFGSGELKWHLLLSRCRVLTKPI